MARSRVFRFPDIVDARVLDLGEGRSTVAIYSRSLIGRRDFGVNRRRIERWLRGIDETVQAVSDATVRSPGSSPT